MLINLMTLCAFAVDLESAGDRFGISLTMVLTSVAFKLQAASDLPDLSYLTWIDQFILGSFFYIFLVVAENFVAVFFNALSAETDRYMCYGFLLLWFLMGVNFTWSAIKLKKSSVTRALQNLHAEVNRTRFGPGGSNVLPMNN